MIKVGDTVAYALDERHTLMVGIVRATWPCEHGNGCVVYSVRNRTAAMFTHVHSNGGVLLPYIDWRSTKGGNHESPGMRLA